VTLDLKNHFFSVKMYFWSGGQENVFQEIEYQGDQYFYHEIEISIFQEIANIFQKKFEKALGPKGPWGVRFRWETFGKVRLG
jgi:hypothetical protein